MNCEYCGNPLPAGAREWPACGASCTGAGASEKSKKESRQTIPVASGNPCPYCGTTVPFDQKNCPACGRSLFCRCGEILPKQAKECPVCKTPTDAFVLDSEKLKRNRRVWWIGIGVTVLLLALSAGMFFVHQECYGDYPVLAGIVAWLPVEVLLLIGLFFAVPPGDVTGYWKPENPLWKFIRTFRVHLLVLVLLFLAMSVVGYLYSDHFLSEKCKQRALYSAVMSDSPSRVRSLCRAGARPDLKMVWIAAEKDDWELVKLLFRYDAPVPSERAIKNHGKELLEEELSKEMRDRLLEYEEDHISLDWI